jgi:hypothetical protein
MSERVQFAYMELGGETKIVNTRALKIFCEGEEVAAVIGERIRVKPRSDQAAALDAEVQAVHGGDDAAEGFVGDVQALQQAGMLAFVEASRTQQQVECAKSANDLREERLGSGL